MYGFLISASPRGELEAIQMSVSMGMKKQNIVEAHNGIKCRLLYTQKRTLKT